MNIRGIPVAKMAVALAILVARAVGARADELQAAGQLLRQGQHVQALERVNKYLAQKPRDPQARFLKGLILVEQNRTADAIQIFSGLTEDYPELPEPYNNLAVLYASQGQYEKARAALERAIQTHPSYATAHENLGDIYAKMASQAYDRALQLDRDNSGAETKLALIGELFSGKGGKPTAAAEAAKPRSPEPPIVAAAPAKPPAPPPAAPPAPPPAQPVAKPAPVAAAAPAASAATTPPAAKQEATGSKEAVLAAVQAWAAAWSAQDVDRYLRSYAASFDPGGGETRAQWESTRRDRVRKPKSISVEVSGAKVEFSGADRATVTFRQKYRSDSFKSEAIKSLVMVNTGGKWLIQQEKVGR